MSFQKIGLNWKVRIGFGCLLAIIAVVGGIGYRDVLVNQATSREVEAASAARDRMLELEISFHLQRIGFRDIMMGRGPDVFDDGRKQFLQQFAGLAPWADTPEDRAVYERVRVTYAAYLDRYRDIMEMYRSGRTADALTLFKSDGAKATATELKTAISQLAASYERRHTAALEMQARAATFTRRLLLGLVFFGFVLGGLIAGVIANSISSTLQTMLTMIQSIATNNLAVADMRVAGHDEIGAAASGLNGMKNSLRNVILSIATTADDVSASSQAISAAAAQAAHSAGEQKQQMDELNDAIHAMNVTVERIAAHSASARSSAGSAVENACDGGLVFDEVLACMKGIDATTQQSARQIDQLHARSEDIGRIVGVIDDIATQTDLLALNASIEAARAGEQGRGFAVVAGEVRRLAVRTSEATGEIAAVIRRVQAATTEAVEQIRAGSTTVQESLAVTGRAGETIQQMIVDARHVGAVVEEIAAATGVQSGTTTQVSATVSRISRLVTDSAQGAQTSAEACSKLFQLVLRLQGMVSSFQVA